MACRGSCRERSFVCHFGWRRPSHFGFSTNRKKILTSRTTLEPSNTVRMVPLQNRTSDLGSHHFVGMKCKIRSEYCRTLAPLRLSQYELSQVHSKGGRSPCVQYMLRVYARTTANSGNWCCSYRWRTLLRRVYCAKNRAWAVKIYEDAVVTIAAVTCWLRNSSFPLLVCARLWKEDNNKKNHWLWVKFLYS